MTSTPEEPDQNPEVAPSGDPVPADPAQPGEDPGTGPDTEPDLPTEQP